VGWGLFMTLKGTTTLKFFADLSGLLAGGLLRMFLLGMMSRRVANGIAVEVLVIARALRGEARSTTWRRARMAR
jgi:hypothetical protein